VERYPPPFTEEVATKTLCRYQLRYLDFLVFSTGWKKGSEVATSEAIFSWILLDGNQGSLPKPLPLPTPLP